MDSATHAQGEAKETSGRDNIAPCTQHVGATQRSDVRGCHRRAFGSAVTVQRTLEFVPLGDVGVLLSVDVDLCGEVALFLALRFNAWLRQLVCRRLDTVSVTAADLVAARDAWMNPAACFLLAHRITPGHEPPPMRTTKRPSWLTALSDVPSHAAREAHVVPLTCGDVVHEWIMRVALRVDTEDGRCCAEYTRDGVSVLRFVRCDERSFYVALEHDHRACMTVQAAQGCAKAVDLGRVPNATCLWLPPGITSVDTNLVRVNRTLASIDLSSCATLSELVDDGFAQNCKQLTSVALSPSVTSIGSHFCKDNPALTTIDLSSCSALTHVGYWFARSCPRLTSVALPASVTSIGPWFCVADVALTTLDLSSCAALTKVNDGFARDCKRLTSVALPSSVTAIGHWFCEGDVALATLDLSSCTALTQLGSYFARGCENLTAVSFPSSLATNPEAFRAPRVVTD